MYVECLEILKGDDFREDFFESPVCPSCAESCYAACAGCARAVAVDEAVAVNSGADEVVYRCPECKFSAPEQAEMDFDAAEAAKSVDEYVGLHAEEKRIKEQLEAIKERLKVFAETRSKNLPAIFSTGSPRKRSEKFFIIRRNSPVQSD